MLRHVCVAYDGREPARPALELAAELARLASARLTVARVVPPVDEVVAEDDGLLGEIVGPAARVRNETVAATDRLAGDLETDVRVLSGRGSDQMLALLDLERPDLVVAGAGLRRPLLSGAPCPVVVVPSGAGRAPLALPTIRPASSLLWQLIAANTAVLVVAALVLIFAPVGVSRYSVVLTEVLVLAAGLAVMLVVSGVLLGRTLAPLRTLTAAMGAVDPLRPGRRLPEIDARAEEVAALAEAFDAMLDRLETERRESSRRALAAQEDERKRIAREMHDELGQTLTALTIQAERAEAMDPVDHELLDQLARTALRGLEDVRRIGRELRPEALDDLGLGNALITLCRRLDEHSGVRIAASLDVLPPLRSEVELVVYRIAQEAVTNALRHAEAAHVEVRLASSSTTLELNVRDDGRGMPAVVADDTAGISGMRERALLVGGDLGFSPAPGGGTEVRLIVPLEEALA